MGQIQQMCLAQIDHIDSSITISRTFAKNQDFQKAKDKMSSGNQETITETINQSKSQDYKEDSRENLEVDTNTSQVESFQKAEDNNISEKGMEEITDYNQQNNSTETANRSKSWSLQSGCSDPHPKGILKNKDANIGLQEKRNSSLQKKVRFSVKDLMKKKGSTKYCTYKKVSYL